MSCVRTRFLSLAPPIPAAAALAAVALAVSACGAGTTPQAKMTAQKTGQSAQITGQAAASGGRLRVAAHPSKILVVIEENHSRTQMMTQMPYLARLSRTYGYATNWHAIMHPSEPNYLAITGGSTFGVTNDQPPSVNETKVGSARSVFGQARAAGKSAGTFAQSMPKRCALKNHGNYAVRHNPRTFYSSERADCRVDNRSTARFAARARADRLPDVGFLIPDLAHDAHDGSLATADRWLRKALRPVLASRDFRTGKLVVVVTADEDDAHSGNIVLTSVLSAQLHHKVVRTPLNHYSLTRFIDQVLGVRALRHARTAPDMKAAFGL